MKSSTLLVLVLLVVLLAGGGTVVVKREQIADALRRAFARYKLPPEWGPAIAKVESGFSMGALVLTGSDGARGGAWGPTQITEKTARAHGYAGPMASLTTDPELAAEWTARILAAGKPRTIEDAGAWWNAGRPSFASLGPTHVTRTKYVPRLVAALEELA